MDINKLLKDVVNLSQYITTTQDASEKYKNSKIQLNMSTVLALKKIQSLEIEYFNKFDENGIACVIFECILRLPPSKTWGVIGKELVTLLQYWLDALRKHLVKHNLHWWTFMKLLMRFMKELHTKDVSLPNVLVEHATECLLDLATNDRPDAIQRQQILHCLNMCCSDCSRELRFALRNRFGGYFLKLSRYMSCCGHLPCQYGVLETLLRWLVPRQDRPLRAAAAAKWFPPTLYSETVAAVFLERSWINFFQDARDLLNAHNDAGTDITSVVCKKLAVGNVVIITGSERQGAWLDINSPTKCMSVLLDPRVLEVFGFSNNKAFDTLIIGEDNTQCVKLYRQDHRLIISVTTLRPPQALMSNITAHDSCDVTIVVTSRDIKRLDAALRSIYCTKYQILLDLEKELLSSPLEEERNKDQISLQDPRFSHPVKGKRRCRSGYIVKRQEATELKSPSTASTTSLALLHDRLTALPLYHYDKKPMSVCALPDLSVVSEVSETERLSHKHKPYGVIFRRRITPSKSPTRKSKSDGENNKRNRQLSPVDSNKKATSCLLVSTIGSADDSYINDTLERLSKRKDYNQDNIVDLLMQEALEASINKDENIDSGINTGDRKTQNGRNAEVVENTPDLKVHEDIRVEGKKRNNKPSKVVDSTTTDESNTECINDTPVEFVNVRNRKKIRNEVDLLEKHSFDVQMVEDFFSQHFTENKAGESIVSPTLAKKINETSSETSDFGDNYNLEKEVINDNCDYNNIDVIECLNNMVDKVCDEFDKCTEYLNKDDEITTINNRTETGIDNRPLHDIMNTLQDQESKKGKPKKGKSKSKKIKLKFKITPKKVADCSTLRVRQRKDKLGLASTSKMSTIIEDNTKEDTINENNKEVIDKAEAVTKNRHKVINEINEIADVVNKNSHEIIDNEKSTTDLNKEASTPILRRKRKLYSPKDDLIDKPKRKLHSPKDDFIEKSIHIADIEEDDIALSEFKLKNTPKTAATCYKEIERDRQRHIRMPRNKKSKSYVDSPSPRTKKRNDIFDKLKETSEGEKVTLADKKSNIEVYNFTSDSEDEDFKAKLYLRKRNSNTTVTSVESTRSTRRRVNRGNNSEKKSENKPKRKVTRRKRTKANILEPTNEILDERMREAKDDLNASIVLAQAKNKINDPELVLKEPPTMEIIDDIIASEKPTIVPQKKKNTKTNKAENIKSKNTKNKNVYNKLKAQDDRTESPLPGLVVEPIPDADYEIDLSANMVDKFKKIYQDGPESYINETNTTHNMLSDIEKVDNTTNNINIIEEINLIDDPIEYNDITNNKKISRPTSHDYRKTDTGTSSNNRITCSRTSIDVIKLSEVNSERSIATQGITAHGDMDETPPKLLEKNIQDRDIEDLDQSIKDYFNELAKDILSPTNNDSNDSNIKNPSEDTAKSLGVSITRLSPKEIRRYSKNTKLRSEASASPVVSLKRLSTEDISRWLPSRRNSYTDSSKTNVSLNKNEVINRPTYDSDENRISRIDDKFHTPKDNRISQVSNIKYKRSMISPIKLFDDLIYNCNNEPLNISLSDDEEYMQEIKNTIAKNGLKSLRNENRVTSSDSSSVSNVSTSTKKIYALKRVSTEERVISKKQKVDLNEAVDLSSGSGAVSSIRDWCKMNKSASTGEEILKDVIENIIERLDTTLVETQQYTSKRFVYLFVNVQRLLSEQKQERERNSKEMMDMIVTVLNNMFTDLNKKSTDAEESLMKLMKEQASEFIREDSNKKRAMARLIREDFQAALDNANKQKGSP